MPAHSGLDLRTLGSVAQARREIKQNTIDAAYVVQDGRYQLLGSSAHGATAYHALEGIFTGVAAARGAQLQVIDVVPAVPADPNGVSIFYLIFGMTLGAFVFGQTIFLVGKRLTAQQKLLATLVFAVVLGVIGGLIAQTWSHVLPGSLLAVGGIMVFLAAAIGAFTVAMTMLLGDGGVAISTITGLILGTAVSGGPVPADFLPSGFAFFSSALPPGATVTALRDIAYYNAADAVRPLGVLTAWLVISVLVILVTGALRGRSARVPAAARGEAVPAVR